MPHAGEYAELNRRVQIRTKRVSRVGFALVMGIWLGAQPAIGQFSATATGPLMLPKLKAASPEPTGTQRTFYQSPVFQVAVFSGITAGLILFADDPIDQAWGIDKNYGPLELPKHLARVGKVYDDIGPAPFSLGLTALSFGGGLVFKDKKLIKTSELMLKSLVAAFATTGALKLILGRERPYVNSGPHNFNLFKFTLEDEFVSMPSGHVSSVFAVMTVIAKQYPKLWVQIPAYTFAISVALQRIDSRNHSFVVFIDINNHIARQHQTDLFFCLQ